MKRLSTALLAIFFLSCAAPTDLGTWALPPAAAQPTADAVEPPGVTPPMPLTQLGLSDEIELVGSNQSADTSLPVPIGVLPGVLTGQIGSVVNVVNGRVEVVDARGVVLGTIPVPTDLTSIPFAIDLQNAQIVDGRAAVGFILRDNTSAADSCSQRPSLTLSQLATTFSGPTPNPTNVADFLPGYLDQIVIRVGSRPTESQQQAALDLVARLTHLYRPMPVRINVTTDEGPAPVGSSTRVIDIRSGAQAGMVVENPGTPEAMLVITGSGPELERQVDLFSDRRIGLAQTPSAAVLSTHQDATQTTNIKTFGQLGMTGEASVLGTDTLYAGFDVAAFGLGSISRASVHLKARYTPVVGGDASVVVRSGSTILATERLDDTGVLDIIGDIPPESITSNVGVAIELRYLPDQECAPLSDRITFWLDPQSTVSVTPGIHNRGGFPVLPMAFTPEFDVAVDAPEHLAFAAQAVNLLSQHSTVLMQPRVTTLQAAASSRMGTVVVATGEELAKANLNAPLLPGGADSVKIDDTLQTDVNLNGPLGVVQAFTQNDRVVLAVSGVGDWSLTNETFNYIRGLDNRWASLSGDVVATGAVGRTVSLTIHEGAGLVNEHPGRVWQWWAWVSIGVSIGLVAAAVAVALVLWRRRNEARTGSPNRPAQTP
ncbi:hypothetical protein JRC04_28395 [Mycolicibacterium sp. S2-37]|uniref:hypothetical protein n=1 Tax=Mycolicibacterium sp. S2-37 TaxID=2810297 RepID=UPI001A9490DA|nr:hypothetical protein [Mycolicibacterium sp. S2-37]MBO0681401.1 hypothetical protein [Mycolicibacterium sp. S2-37]